MRIRMLQNWKWKTGFLKKDQILYMTPNLCQPLLDRGVAVEAPVEVEAPTVEPTERAVLPTAKKRRSRRGKTTKQNRAPNS